MRPPLIVLAVLVLLPALSRAADDKTYELKLERPYTVGHKTKVEALGAYRNKLVARTEGEDPKSVDESAGVRLDGVSEVKAVTKGGRRTKVAFTVSNCTLMVGQKERQLLPEGKVVEARWEKDTTKYKVDGKDVPDELTEIFDLVLELPDPEGATDDEIFRTAGKKKVNDSWSIDPAVTKKEFERIGLKVKEDDLWGETTLLEETKVGDKPAVKLKTEFKVKSLSGPGRKPDAKFKLLAGTLSVQATATLPLDETLQATAETVKVNSTGELLGKNDDGKEVKISRTTERVMERTMKPDSGERQL
jgi:hypothetical protein